jgi:O-antigen/teichoic acid export membrane protein
MNGTSMREVISSSAGITMAFGFSQVVGLIARIFFRTTLSSDQYGIFAFFIGIFQLAVTMNGLTLHVPLIAAISADTSDKETHRIIFSQIFTVSLLLGSIIGFIFFIYTAWITSMGYLAAFLSVWIVIYSTSNIAHCLPRGLDWLRPSAVSSVLVGVGRLLMLVLLVFFIVADLTSITILYTLPLLSGWVTYVYYLGKPSISRPKPEVVRPIYTDAAISYMATLAMQIPLFLGMVVLVGFHGFGAVGDFDIAMIPYSALSMIVGAIYFVTINKARTFPDFRVTMKRIRKLAGVPLVGASIGLTILAILFESTLKQIIIAIGLPSTVYWPAVILVVFASPIYLVLLFIMSFFSGRGIIKPARQRSEGQYLISKGSRPRGRRLVLPYYQSGFGMVHRIAVFRPICLSCT